MHFWTSILVWKLAAALDVSQRLLNPSQSQRSIVSYKRPPKVRALLHASAVADRAQQDPCGPNKTVDKEKKGAQQDPDPAEDDYVFAACVWLRELKLAWPERPANVTTDENMTVTMCSERCKTHKSIHFALSEGNSCLCFDHFDAAPHEEDPPQCDVPCAGDSASMCGGQGAPQPLQVYTYAHHAIEPEKDAIWLCGPISQPKGSVGVTGDGMMRSLLCAEGHVPSQPGGAQLLCDADKRKWVPEGKCISLAEALETAKSKHSAAIEAAKCAQEKADKAEIDAAEAAEEARKAKEDLKGAQMEAARLSRVACKELTSAAPKVETAETSTELTAYAEGAGVRARAAADGLSAAKAAAEKVEAAVKAIPEKSKAAEEAAEAAQKAIAKEKAMADMVANREAAMR